MKRTIRFSLHTVVTDPAELARWLVQLSHTVEHNAPMFFDNDEPRHFSLRSPGKSGLNGSVKVEPIPLSATYMTMEGP